MPLARSRLRTRRADLTRTHGHLNLIPLVDILTAIVFFSLLSFVTLRSALASFDLEQPPEGTELDATTSSAPQVVVRVDRDRFVLRHAAGETTIARSIGPDTSLTTLQETLTDLARTLGARVQVTVVPSDDVLYDDLVRVLDEIQRAKPRGVALGARARR